MKRHSQNKVLKFKTYCIDRLADRFSPLEAEAIIDEKDKISRLYHYHYNYCIITSKSRSITYSCY